MAKEANGAFSVKASSPNGRQSFVADLVVHGAGRVPAIEGLQLENAGGGILVNEYLQSVSNPAVYVAGDVAATNGIPLTPVATGLCPCERTRDRADTVLRRKLIDQKRRDKRRFFMR